MRLLSITLTLALAAAAFVAPAVSATDAAGPGRLHLTGAAAAAFVVPRDAIELVSWTDSAHDLTYTRYQQSARPFGVHVEGAQLTVVKRGGEHVLVIGSHYAGLKVVATPAIDAFRAKAIAAATSGRFDVPPDIAALLTQRTELRYDPVGARLFYLVKSGAPGVALFHQVDAQTGAVIDAWNAIAHAAGDGTGVKGDTKNLTASFGNLTSQQDGTWKMRSPDGHFTTYSANGGQTWSWSSPVSDGNNGNDNVWSATNQRAAVDAQYYAALTAAFYQDRLGFDLFGDLCTAPTAEVPDPVFESGIRSVVHYDDTPNNGKGYANAFWEPFEHYMAYGDGNSQYRSMAGAQDVVTHELTHAVTQCRADLKYKDQPGALNEAISDIMAAAAEWDVEESLSSNCRLATGQTRCADWLLGEDAAASASVPPFRDFADPQAQGQPSHWADRVYLGWSYDEGGVHFNSGIVNHAFYLLVNGGRNARCSGPTDAQDDCDVVVPPISLEHAERIFFGGFGLLTYTATFCDARETTLAAADALYPGSVSDRVGVDLAWAAVGRDAADCDGPVDDFAVSVTSRVLAVAPGGNGSIGVSVTRGTESDPIDFSVEHGGPIANAELEPSQSITPNNNTELTLDVEAEATDGVYPILIKATNEAVTHYASAALVVDSVGPDVEVGRARFAPAVTEIINGKVKLHITWSATDDVSGLAEAELDHSVTGQTGSWSAIESDYSAAAGPHYYQVVGTDAVGNSATSLALATSLVAVQENAFTYTKTWTKSGTGTSWGTTKFAKRRGASAKYTFTGTDVVWVAQRGPKRGKAYVYIDGVRSSVSLYASSLQERRVVFVATNLAPGQHTIKIVCRGTNNRPRVDVDGIFVLNQ